MPIHQPSFGPNKTGPKMLQDESISSNNYLNSIGSSHGEGIVRPFCLNVAGTPVGYRNQLQNHGSGTLSNQTPEIQGPVTHFQVD